MKQFFYIVFGGLISILVGLCIAYIASYSWSYIQKGFNDKLIKKTPFNEIEDITTVSGISRTIRFSASEEEGLFETFGISSTTKITAKSYAVLNVNTDEFVLSKNPDKVLPIASIAKLVTAVIAKEKMNPEKRVSIDRKIISAYGNTAGLKVGETLTVGNLLYPLLMVSSNDSAEAIAGSYGRKKFIQEMNNFAQSIGAYRTYFYDPSGISPKNIASANDVVLIFKLITEHYPELVDITKIKTHTIRNHTWVNPLHMLNQSTYDGGKNGYLPEAGRTGVMMFSVNEGKRKFIICILGSSARDQDFISLLDRAEKI
jgi:D-alanyl-D-alanine endopeptidase (penicillin-binding protein 7)